MKLLKARVTNYKSIEDSNEFKINDVTCLVGKNESGKTAIIQSLYKLKPILSEDDKFNDTLDYPRKRWSSYKRNKDDSPANVLTTEWQLEAEDLDLVKPIVGESGLRNNIVEITKGYDNISYWTFNFDEVKVIETYKAKVTLYKEETEEIKNIKGIGALVEYLEGLENISERQNELLALLQAAFPNKSVGKALISALSNNLPRFVYFADYYKLPGQVAIDRIISKSEDDLDFEDQVFLALLELAGTTPEEINKKGKFEELIAELESVSNDLSDKIFKYWTQNKHLKVEFRLDAARPEDEAPFNKGNIFRTRIENTRHRATVSFDERSTGFIWFFSFLVWFSQAESNYGEKLIILLDEPGLSLHGKAQYDLLRYINEELKPKYQVLYTTHSPFMVPNSLEGVRTVEDVIKKEDLLGTKVSEELYTTDKDTIFPLQAALGYDISQSLFIGENSLLVEGPSDLLYLKWFSEELKQLGREGLDSNWIITPCGGLDKVASFVALFGGNKLNVAVLTDFHKGDKAKVKNLKESHLLSESNVLSAEQYTDADESDIEDIIGFDNYSVLVNECYGLKSKQKLPPNQSGRATEIVETYFRTLPPEIKEFDHYTPSAFLVENSSSLKKIMPNFSDALDRFEKLFSDINKLLKK